MIESRRAILALLAASLSVTLAPAPYAQAAASADVVSELDAAKGTSRFPSAFAAALDGAADVDALVALVDRYVSALSDPVAAGGAWTRAAATLELAGRFDEAAERYGKAAAAVPGSTDPELLLAASACWLQAGECGRALAVAELAALSSSDPALDWRAGLVGAWAHVCGEDSARAGSALDALRTSADDPTRKAAVLLLAWAMADGDERAALAAELSARYPGSPEALVASGTHAPSPFWFLAFPRPPAAGKEPSAVASADPVAKVPTVTAAPAATGGPRGYQVGSFAERANAERLAAALRAKGFDVVLEGRERTGAAPVLAVLVPVPAGGDPAALLLRLKDAGFEAWPVF